MTKTLDVVDQEIGSRSAGTGGSRRGVVGDPAESERGRDRRALARRAIDPALALTGPRGLLKSLTKTVLETFGRRSLRSIWGYDDHYPAGRHPGKSAKTTPIPGTSL